MPIRIISARYNGIGLVVTAYEKLRDRMMDIHPAKRNLRDPRVLEAMQKCQGNGETHPLDLPCASPTRLRPKLEYI